MITIKPDPTSGVYQDDNPPNVLEIRPIGSDSPPPINIQPQPATAPPPQPVVTTQTAPQVVSSVVAQAGGVLPQQVMMLQQGSPQVLAPGQVIMNQNRGPVQYIIQQPGSAAPVQFQTANGPISGAPIRLVYPSGATFSTGQQAPAPSQATSLLAATATQPQTPVVGGHVISQRTNETPFQIQSVTSLQPPAKTATSTAPPVTPRPVAPKPAPIAPQKQVGNLTATISKTGVSPARRPNEPGDDAAAAGMAKKPESMVFGLMRVSPGKGPSEKDFFCNFCLCKTNNQQKFLDHITSHLFVCGSCGYRSFARVEVVGHIIKEHPAEKADLQSLHAMHLENVSLNFRSPGKGGMNEKEKKSCISNVLSGKEIDMPVADAQPKTEVTKKEKKVHSDDEPIMMQFIRLNNKKEFQCMICGTLFNQITPMILTSHQRLHPELTKETLPEYLIACPHCYVCMQDMDELKQHFNEIHKVLAKNKALYGIREPDGKMFSWMCIGCGQTNSNRKIISKHVLASHGKHDMACLPSEITKDSIPEFLRTLLKAKWPAVDDRDSVSLSYNPGGDTKAGPNNLTLTPASSASSTHTNVAKAKDFAHKLAISTAASTATSVTATSTPAMTDSSKTVSHHSPAIVIDDEDDEDDSEPPLLPGRVPLSVSGRKQIITTQITQQHGSTASSQSGKTATVPKVRRASNTRMDSPSIEALDMEAIRTAFEAEAAREEASASEATSVSETASAPEAKPLVNNNKTAEIKEPDKSLDTKTKEEIEDKTSSPKDTVSASSSSANTVSDPVHLPEDGKDTDESDRKTGEVEGKESTADEKDKQTDEMGGIEDKALKAAVLAAALEDEEEEPSPLAFDDSDEDPDFRPPVPLTRKRKMELLATTNERSMRNKKRKSYVDDETDET